MQLRGTRGSITKMCTFHFLKVNFTQKIFPNTSKNGILRTDSRLLQNQAETPGLLEVVLVLFFDQLSCRYQYDPPLLLIAFIFIKNLQSLIFFSLKETEQCQIVLQHCSLFHKQQKALRWQKQLFHGLKMEKSRKSVWGKNFFFMGPYLRRPSFNKTTKKIILGKNNVNVTHRINLESPHIFGASYKQLSLGLKGAWRECSM